MNTKATIRKVLFAMLWVCIGGGMLTLLIAAIGKNNNERCSNYVIRIKDARDNFFIDEKDIIRLLTAATGSDLKGMKIKEINLERLENLLEENVWINNAEIWIDNRSVLYVSVKEREPVARIFTKGGYSFYIDSSEARIPLSDKMSAVVPVFTGFPDRKILLAKDSLLLKDIKRTALYIISNPFWMSQVSQIDITADGNPTGASFDMIPLAGNHIIKLGNGNDIEKKFERLMIFYRQVLAKTGFDIYSTIDVQYAGQVTGTRRGTEKKMTDTLKLRRNIDNLLRQANQQQTDAVTPVTPANDNNETSTGETNDISAGLKATSTQATNPNTVKAQSLPNENNVKTGAGSPKAVMPKRNRN